MVDRIFATNSRFLSMRNVTEEVDLHLPFLSSAVFLTVSPSRTLHSAHRDIVCRTKVRSMPDILLITRVSSRGNGCALSVATSCSFLKRSGVIIVDSENLDTTTIPMDNHQSGATESILKLESRLRTAVVEAQGDSDGIFALCALAQFLADIARDDEAVEFFEKAIARSDYIISGDDDERSCVESESIKKVMGLAMGWYAGLVEGNGPEGAGKAEALYTRALEMNAQDPLCMGNYAMFLHRIKKDYQVRIEHQRCRMQDNAGRHFILERCGSSCHILGCRGCKGRDGTKRQVRAIFEEECACEEGGRRP